LVGIFITQEGTALWAVHKQLKSENRIAKHEKAVLINIGSGYKHMENIFARIYLRSRYTNLYS